ncbi:hypothetical protein [Streptomyces rubiginosohelvolus]
MAERHLHHISADRAPPFPEPGFTLALKAGTPRESRGANESCLFGLAIGLAALLYQRHNTVDGDQVSFTAFALFMGAAMSITAFPVVARMLAGLSGHKRIYQAR